MNRGEIRAEVRRLLGESTDFWTDSDINDSINDGLEEMAESSEYYVSDESENLSTNPIYNLKSLLTREILQITSIYNDQTSRWLYPTETHLLNKRYRRWESITGQPEAYYMRGLWHLRPYPKSAAASGTFHIYYTAMPPKLTADGDSPGFPVEFQWGLVEYALYDLLVQDQETDEALMHFAKYAKYEIGLTAWVKQRGNYTGVIGGNN